MAPGVLPCAQETRVFFDRRWSPKSTSAAPDVAQPDVIVVHDLASHRPTSRIQGEEDNARLLWLEDVLQRNLPRAKIMSFSPTSNADPVTVFNAKGLKARGTELLKFIYEERARERREKSTIIFIVFGLGSLIVKKALLIAQGNELFKSIGDQTSNLVSIGPAQHAVDVGSKDILALNMIGASIQQCRHSLSRIIEMFSVAIVEIYEEFLSVAGRYRIVSSFETEHIPCMDTPVADNFLSTFDTPSEERLCMERIPLKMTAPSEESEDKLLMISDKIRFLARSDSIRGATWYDDYLSMLSQIHPQQYTCPPVSEHPQTLKWLLSHETYLAWMRNSDPCLLYIHGRCGVGKTTLSSFLWKSLYTASQAGEDGAIITLYFSFNLEDKRRNSTMSLLSSFIYQLLTCRPQIFTSIKDHYDWIQWSWPLTVEELWILFRCLISYPVHQGIICIIDAIDQCDVPLDTTLQEFLAFSASREANLKVVATSRVLPGTLHPPPLFSIDLDLQKEVVMDMEACAKMHVHDLLQRNGAFLEFEKDIVEEFQNRRTHLEITLGFESLKSPTLRSTPGSIRKALQSLICSPSDLCDHILNETARLPSWACTALSWILHAFRPLTLDELSIAVAIRETTTSYSEIENDIPRDIARDLKQIFGGMLSVNHDEICLIHQSIKDYLLIHLTLPGQDHLLFDLTHTSLARRCLAYLSFADLEENLSLEPVKASSQDYSSPGKFELIGYAAEYWPEHYQKAEERHRLCGDVLEFLGNAKHVERLNKARRPAWDPHPRPISSLQIAAKLGLTEIVSMLLLQDNGNDITHNDKEAALEMAVGNNHVETATQLLNDGTTSKRALGLAARHGNIGLVRQLIHGNDLKVSNTDGALESDEGSDTDELSFFHMAALRGHTVVIGTLLEVGAIPKSTNRSGDTPSSLAVKGGQLAALQQFLGADSKVSLADNTDFSLLHLAAREGHLEIVQELIRIGADPNAIGIHGLTPLLVAAERGHLVLVKELINNMRADLKATNEAVSCAVHVAAVRGHVRVFEQLCKVGADVKVKDKQGSQPIHLAAKGGHLGVIKTLLGLGVDTNSVDGRKLTPLHLATRGGHLRIVQELLKHSRSVTRNVSDLETNGSVGIRRLDESAGNANKDYVAPEDGAEVEMDASPDSSDIDPTRRSEESFDESDDMSFDESDDMPFDESDDDVNPSKFHDFNEPTPLHSAAVRGCVEIVRELLKADAQCNICSKRHLTPLHLAAREGHFSVVKALLQHNADPNIADAKESSPLHAASTAGNLSIVKVLLSFGADVNKTDDKQVAPLHHAARHGHNDVVRQLLEAGAEIEAANAIGQTPLHIAVNQRRSDVVAALLVKGANPNATSRQGWTALHFAVGAAEIEIDLLAQILQGGADVHASNKNGSTALFLAAESGSEAAVRSLLKAGAKADARNEAKSSPMHRAAQGGHLTVVKLLMEAGGNPLAKKKNDITPLQLAIMDGFLDVAAQLLEPMDAKYPPINEYEEILYYLARVGFEEGITKVLEHPLRNLERGDSEYSQSPLSHAAENGHARVVQILLGRGADPNSVDKTGRTPLSWAALNEHVAVAKQLLEAGANIQSKDRDQWTALHIAIQTCSTPMVNLLIDMGADTSATLNGMQTPLHLAAQADEPALVRLLVTHGADISSRNDYLVTPMEHAVMFGSVSMVELMLDLGANVLTPSSDGWTLIHRAMSRGNESIVDLLVRRCSDTFTGQQGWTRLHLAALNGDKDWVRELLEKGADRALRDQNGLMALHWAAARSHEDVVRLLLEMETEVRAKDNEGMTALHHAASRDNERIVRALLEKGAERNITDLHGWTPLQIAQMYAKDDVRDTLLENNETTMIPGTRAGLAPSRWVKAIDSSDITISEDGLTAIADKASQFELNQRLHIRTDQPMPAGAYTFYFEVTIVNAGRKNLVGIGFCEDDSRRVGMPGWARGSWGYHGDDGQKFSNYEVGKAYGPTYREGDVVGCGVDFMSKSAFFTKNGEKLETAFIDITGRLYPVVGIGERDVEVTVNFGQSDFVFKDLGQ